MKTRKTRRANIQSKQIGLMLNSIEPLTDNQTLVFESDNNLVMHGCAGTGKSFIGSYLALKDILDNNLFNRLIYIRSAVPTRDMGFLPGTDKEKAEVYEIPYKDICSELFSRDDAYEILKQKNIIHFMTTSFIRGTTMKDAVILVDECQNMSYHELDSIITRVGENCRIIFCGDFNQADLKGNGIKDFYTVLKQMNEFDFIDFTIQDIVRSEFVKSYLVAKYETNIQ